MQFNIYIKLCLFILNKFYSYFNVLYKNIIFFLKWVSCITLFITIIISLIITTLFCLPSYYFYTYFTEITNENLETFFTNYNNLSKKTLEKYGSNKITKAFCIKQTIPLYSHYALSFFSFNKWNKKNNIYYHYSIVFETVDKNGVIRYIRVEKTPSIRISSNFEMTDADIIIPIKLKKKKSFTIQSIIDKTRQKMGDNKFFNLSVKNNCQLLIINMISIIHADKNTSLKKNQLLEYSFSDLSFYIMNWCAFLSSFYLNPI